MVWVARYGMLKVWAGIYELLMVGLLMVGLLLMVWVAKANGIGCYSKELKNKVPEDDTIYYITTH